MQQTRVTDSFRQRKPGSSRGKATKKAEAKAVAEQTEDVASDDLSAEERVLRAFDLATQFGPCVGITRMERWQRAERFGLNPPAEVKVLLSGPHGSQLNNCLWEGRL